MGHKNRANKQKSGMKKLRLDELLVMRGFFSDREQAMRAVLAGEITSPEIAITSPSQIIDTQITLKVKTPPRFVSRGGVKLQGALDALNVDPKGLACIDVGASSGGFTDCLLINGAASVCAVDVGYGQFAWRLRQDSRVKLFERTNIRKARVTELGGPFDLLVADLSFVSLASLIDVLVALVSEGGQLLMLLKPQFELRKDQVDKGGVVKDPAKHVEVLTKMLRLLPNANVCPLGVCASPISGFKGNFEFFVLAKRMPDNWDRNVKDNEEELVGMIMQAVKAAHSTHSAHSDEKISLGSGNANTDSNEYN